MYIDAMCVQVIRVCHRVLSACADGHEATRHRCYIKYQRWSVKTNNGNLEQYTCRSESEGVNQPRFLFPPITEVVGLAVDADAVPGAFSGC